MTKTGASIAIATCYTTALVLQLWAGQPQLFTADSVTNKTTVAYRSWRCHRPAVQTAVAIGSVVRPSGRWRRPTRLLCASTPFMELNGGDFREKCNPTRWDRVVSGSNSALHSHFCRPAESSLWHRKISPSKLITQSEIRVKSACFSCWRTKQEYFMLQMGPHPGTHLGAAVSVSGFASYLRYNHWHKTELCYPCDCILCTNLTNVPLWCGFVNSACQCGTGNSLSGSKPLFFSFPGPKHIIKKTLKHRFQSVYDAAAAQRMNISVQHWRCS